MKSSCREGGVDLQIVPRPSWGKKNNTLTGSSSGLGHCSFPVTRPTPARQQSVFYCFIFTLFMFWWEHSDLADQRVACLRLHQGWLGRDCWQGWRRRENAPAVVLTDLQPDLGLPVLTNKTGRTVPCSCPAPVLLTRTSRLRTTNRTKTQGATPSHYKNKYQDIITIHLSFLLAESGSLLTPRYRGEDKK